MRAYKWTFEGGRDDLGEFTWPLPTSNAPGAWVRMKGRVKREPVSYATPPGSLAADIAKAREDMRKAAEEKEKAHREMHEASRLA